MMIGQLTAEGPRCSGSREGWKQIEPCFGASLAAAGTKTLTKAMIIMVCLMRSHFIERRGVIEMRRLQDRQPVLESAGLYRIDRPGVLVRLAVDRHDLILAGSQNPRQRVLAERLLTHHD